MMFWDASAVVALIVPETQSADVHRLRNENKDITVWWGTEVECVSALYKSRRANRLTDAMLTSARGDLSTVLSGCEIVLPSEPVRERAVRLLATHAIGSADALQLAAALIFTQERPSGTGFVCLDSRLREAAFREGFVVLPVHSG